eukprot:2268756-Ditylum_brightwellii.AAC.1
MGICSWCAGENCDQKEEGEDEDQLLLCDSCPRAFCVRCVCLAHGGGEQGHNIVKELMENTADKWLCPGCDQPPALKKM